MHTFCHSVPDTWYQMGVILAATDCLNWLAAQLGSKPAELSALLGDRIKGPGNIRFLPYLSGERTPHNDARVRGAFVGLGIGDGHKELTQAVMEGVGFALKDNHEALKATGTTLKRVLGIGGGSKSDYWVEMIATLLGVPIDLPENETVEHQVADDGEPQVGQSVEHLSEGFGHGFLPGLGQCRAARPGGA